MSDIEDRLREAEEALEKEEQTETPENEIEETVGEEPEPAEHPADSDALKRAVQKHQVADGMLKKQGQELKDMRAALAEQKEREQQLLQRLDQLESRKQEEKRESSVDTLRQSLAEKMTDDEFEASRTIAETIMKPDIERLQNEIAALREQLSETRRKTEYASDTSQRTSEDIFKSTLESKVNPAALNAGIGKTIWQLSEDRGFIDFIDARIHAGSAFTRRDIINSGLKNSDAASVASVFTEYIGRLPKKKTSSLEKVIQPSSVSSAPDTASDRKRTFTHSEYMEIMNRITRGSHYTPEQADKLERELDAAMAEGRVQ